MSHYVVIIAIDSLWENMQSLKNEKKKKVSGICVSAVCFGFLLHVSGEGGIDRYLDILRIRGVVSDPRGSGW